MAYLLNLVYVVLLVVASPWIAYSALRKGKYREGLAAKLLGIVPRRQGPRPCLWLHGVSVGEVNLLRTLVTHLQDQLPDHECVISTTTQTGFRLARSKFPDCVVFYCPLDFSWAVAAAVDRIRPDLLVLAELELWPNLIATAKRSGAKVAVINGRLSPASFRGYQRLRPFIASCLKRLDLIAVQNQEYANRFRQLAALEQCVSVTGSIKFDGAETNRHNEKTTKLARLAGIGPEDRILLAGSTQAPEESVALEVFRRLHSRFPRLRLVLVPRHPERFDEVARLLDRSGMAWQRRTPLDHQPARPEARILLVDTVGELGAWWGTADVALVGGSLGRRGGQNMIEPAAYGAAVTFGPNTRNFRDVVQAMLDANAAVVVQDGDDLEHFVARCLDEPSYRDALGVRARALVETHRGATARTVTLLRQLLADRAARVRIDAVDDRRGPIACVRARKS